MSPSSCALTIRTISFHPDMRIIEQPGILAQLSALADPTRTRLLLVLERQELTVGELCQVVQLPQSTVSRHLKTLADEGWVAARADGASRRYRAATLDDAGRRLWQVVREEVAESAAARHDAHRVDGVLAQRRSTSEEFFATAAGRWDAVRAELFGRGSDLHALLGLLDDAWTVGDLGCGTGSVAAALAPFVRRVVAVDASRAMLAAAAERLQGAPGVELRAGALERLPVTDGELDAAVFSLVLHYVPDPAAALAEARRTLRPGGRLLVVDMMPHDREEYRAEMGHAWLGFDAEQMASWLAAAGFDRVRYQPLPADPAAKGPALFTATARASSQTAAATADLRG